MFSVSEVELDLIDDLKNPELRRQFFRETAKETIASQIRYLREMRNMRQIDLANATGMKQSAVSRLERADYSSWNFNTLMRLGDALDARVRITIESYENVIRSLQSYQFGMLTSIGISNQSSPDIANGLGKQPANIPEQESRSNAA